MFVVGNIIGSLFWGSLIAIVVTVAVWLLCQAVDRAASPVTYIIMVILLILTGAQATMMVGAMYAKGYITDINDYANSLMSTSESITAYNSNFDELRHQIEEEFPIAKLLFDKIDTDGLQAYLNKSQSITDYLTDNLNSTLNWYIIRRILWMMAFVVVAIVAIMFLNRPHDYSYDINSIDITY